MAKTFEQTLDEWVELSRQAKANAKAELALRKQLFEAAFPNPTEGTNKVTISDGREVVFTHKINRSVDETVVPDVQAELRLQNDPDAAPENFFKVKHSLIEGAYKKASDPVKLILTKVVTEKPGAPSLEVR